MRKSVSLRAFRAVVAAAVAACAAFAAAPADAVPTYTVAGVVVDTDGYPIERAWMDIRDEEGLSPPGKGRTKTTGADGKFSFGQLDGGRYRLRVVAPYCAWRRTDLIPAGTLDARVVLEGEKTLPGRVVDAEGKPIGAAQVTVRIPEAAIPPVAETGEDGRFTVRHLTGSAGELVVVAAGRGRDQRAKWVVRKLDVRPSETPATVTMGEGLCIEGTVLDETGAPAAQCGVLAVPFDRAVNNAVLKDHWPSAWTADDGSFRIEGLEKGGYRLARWFGDAASDVAGGDASRHLVGGDEVEAGAKGVKLKLPPK